MRSLTAPDALRQDVLERDGHQCRYCGHEENIDVHHIKHVRNGGEHEEENLITLCRSCHKIAHSIVPDGENPVEVLSEEGIPTEFVGSQRVSRWAAPTLKVLAEGRATPNYISEKTGMDNDRINGCLSDMLSAGWVTKLCHGLYEITDEGKEIVQEELDHA